MGTDPEGRQIAVTGVSRVKVDTEISVPAASNYTALDVISDNATTGTYLTFENVVAEPGGSGTIVDLIVIAQTTDQAHRPTLLFFNAIPTGNLNDNVKNTSPVWADRAKFIGEVPASALQDKGGASFTESVPGDTGLPKPFVCAEGSRDIYAIAITEDDFTNETANDDYFFSILVDQN